MKPIGYIATTPWGLRRVFGTSATRKETHAAHLKHPACHLTPVNESLTPSVWSLLLGILNSEHSEHREQEYRYGKRKR